MSVAITYLPPQCQGVCPKKCAFYKIISCTCQIFCLFLLTELVDKCIGSRIHIVMKSDKEIVGTLLGFDDFVSILWCNCLRPSALCFGSIHVLLLRGLSSLDRAFLSGLIVLFSYFYFMDKITVQCKMKIALNTLSF